MADSATARPDLSPFDVAVLENDDATIYVVDRELRIIYVNAAWRNFARANGSARGAGQWTLGAAALDAVPATLRPFYEELFERARTTDAPVEHSYECSSPAVFRRYRMRIYRCDSGALVVASSLSQEMSHPGVASPALEQSYRDANGIILQCSNCRRVRRVDETRWARWDWVPDYVAELPPRVSHGLCAQCVAYYHSVARADSRPPAPVAGIARVAPSASEAAVLVADGDPSILMLMVRVLRRAGLRVTQAADHAALARALEVSPFDVVVLGALPGDGAVALRAIRRLQPSIRVAVVVGAGSRGAIVGATVLVRTPFTPESLLRAVRDALDVPIA